VGDVVADKGVRVLFEAHEPLATRIPLVLIGRDERGIGREAPPGVAVVGTWPHELVKEAWRRSLLGTMPSLCLDASPTVTLEAMAASRPVVASRLGGLLDQVEDGVTGLLVEPGDAGALRSAIARIVDDPALSESMGAAARARFERLFSADIVIGRIEQLYRSLL
jgi:glycosyltransferase involved in cell wall biosynthesis